MVVRMLATRCSGTLMSADRASAELEGGPLEDDLAQAVQAVRSNGKPLEPELRDEAEAATGADLPAASQVIGTRRSAAARCSISTDEI
jgi:hypothetical protein